MSSLLFEYFTCSLHKAGDTSIGNAARTAAPLLVGMRPTPAGCCNSDMVGIAGVRHDQMLPVSSTHFAYPAESTLTLPNAVTSFSATPPSVGIGDASLSLLELVRSDLLRYPAPRASSHLPEPLFERTRFFVSPRRLCSGIKYACAGSIVSFAEPLFPSPPCLLVGVRAPRSRCLQ